ncbi:MAG: hypothetical protein IJK31_00060 [Ruminococcus sp.]|nr:hypothetical protein [Ruminococcus sp.]
MRKIIDKRVYFTVVSAMTISGFITICTMGQGVKKYRAEMKLAAAATEPAEPLYTVREYNGRAGIFCRGNSEPFRYADINMFLLPDSDREQLREGIGFEDEEELRVYLEDMES